MRKPGRTRERRAAARAAALLLAACVMDPEGPTGLGIRVPDPDGNVPPPSGNGQEWLVNAVLPRPLVAFVFDERTFRGVPDVRVVWRVAAGAGEFASDRDGRPLPDRVATTDGTGRARIRFRPTAAGDVTVTAAVAGHEARVVTFTVTALRDGPVEIRVRPWADLFGCETWFQGPMPSGAVYLRARTPVEWTMPVDAWGSAPDSCEARIVSAAMPPGGQPFDSGPLRPGGSFRFSPNVAGTWEFRDAIGGGGGRLTVLEP